MNHFALLAWSVKCLHGTLSSLFQILICLKLLYLTVYSADVLTTDTSLFIAPVMHSECVRLPLRKTKNSGYFIGDDLGVEISFVGIKLF